MNDSPVHSIHQDAVTRPSAFLEGVALPTSRRQSLFEARRRIEAGGVSAVSFDVFDTLLWRRVPRPTDAFLLLGNDLTEDGELRPWLTPAAFRRLRIEAERRARVAKWHAGGGVEVTLEEIWEQIPSSVLVDPNPERMASTELDLERRITQPDLDIVDFAGFAGESGCQLALVSNTYYTNDKLARLLARSGLEVFNKALLFASCSFGVGKAAGLWDIVLSDLGVAPSRVIHIGDDVAADVEAPKAYGVRPYWYARVDAKTEAVFDREGLFPREPRPPAAVVVDPVEGDLGFTGMRAKVGRRADAAGLPHDFAVAWRYGATVLGPVLTGFADWVHERTLDVGATTAWCMMREGHFLSELVGSVAADRGHHMRAEAIWLSRQVAARAALDQVTQRSLRPLLVRRARPTVGQFVTDLGLSRREAEELPVPATALMEKPEVVEPVIDSLVASDRLSARILASATDARRRLVRYLDRTVGTTEEPLVLVDLGWGGTIQHNLTKVLEIAGIRHRILGLYLIVNQVSCDRILDNREITGYLANVGEPWQDVADIGRSPEVIEQACLAPTGSVVDFNEEGEPILDSSTPPADQVVSRLLVQDGIRAFQSEWLRYDASVSGWPRFDGRERPLLRNVLRTSVVSPTQDEARVFGAWTHEDNFGVHNRERIIPERLAGFVPYLSPLDLAEMEMQDLYWPLGLAAEHDHGLAELTRLVQGDEADPSAFEMDTGLAHAALSADAGGGFGEPQTRALRINRNGLCFARFSVEDAGIQRLRFVPCDHRAVFRIDRIDLELRLRGSSLLQRLSIEDPVELAGLVYSGCHWLTEGIAFATTETPQVHIPLVGRAAGIVDAVRMEVGFAVLQLPRDRAVVPPVADLTTRVTRVLVRARSEAAAGGLRAVGHGALRVLGRSLR